MVHLDRREAQAFQPGRAAGLADEPRERVAGGAVAEAAEVDAGQHHLAMPLIDATTNLREHRRGRAAARGAADERDHAERARERAAVLDLHERSDAVEPVLRVDAADRANVAGDECRGFGAGPPCDDDVRRRPVEGAFEVRGAPRHVDRARRTRRARGGLTRLRDRFVRDAARVDDLDLAALCDLEMTVGEQPLADRLSVRERDLAAEEPRRERRHRASETKRSADSSRIAGGARTGRLPTRPARRTRGGPTPRAAVARRRDSPR